jgi:hypothetical protein
VDELLDEVRRRKAARAVKPPPRVGEPVPPALEAQLQKVGRALADRLLVRDSLDGSGRVQPRVLCMMMQKDEGVLLDPWLRHHARLFGAARLIVLDNGSSDPAVLARLREAEREGVQVVWDFPDREHFEDKGRVFRGLLRRIERRYAYDLFLPLDCDEFVGVMEPDGRVSCQADEVRDYLQTCIGEPRVMFIQGSYFNVVGSPGLYTFRRERKCFFAFDTVKSLSMGFHHGSSRRSEEELTTRLIHFHYRYRPYEQYLSSAKMKLEGRVDRFEAAQVRASRRSHGSHMTRYAFLSEAEYLEHFSGRMDALPVDALERAFAELGMALPY